MNRGSSRLRGVLALIQLAGALVPSARRRDWMDQWRAELWHYEQWLDREGERLASLRLLARASGALPHAIQVRILEWSPRMLIHDLRFAWRLFQKKIGMRMLMDVVPLDAALVKGSHGRRPADEADYPLLISQESELLSNSMIEATDVYHVLKRQVLG